ncbi:nuclear mRNA splicing factor-associated protein [Penicillium lagena]|uniref:nuclear mRNA splicing factor-associated protein n=1 Tax=Penicillium lagena TaxID=94218 RepID=UPI0025411772|nr:nuclear mRNA splicing factor-associated protein [Penicillium lagena]KAJ5620052.1 nuclear mRNA splicing factor-associated protein [Penicillium lagena]
MASPSPENGADAPSRNFPQDPSEFDNDPRISFSKLDDKFILETDDGQEFVFDSGIKRWVQTVWILLAAASANLDCVDVGKHARAFHDWELER